MNQSETDNWKTLGEALKQAFDSRDWFKLSRLDRTIIPASAYDTGADVSDPPFMPPTCWKPISNHTFGHRK